MRTLLISACLGAMLVPRGAQPFAACPTDSVDVCGVTITSAPSFLTSGCAFNAAVASYDLALGKLDAGAPTKSMVTVRTEDRYTLTGPASGNPISFGTVLAVHGSVGGSATCTAQIRDGNRVRDLTFYPCGLSCSFSTTLTLPLAYAVGEPFLLGLYVQGDASNVTLGGGGSNHATISGTLSFALPAAYSITSCQGFNTNPTTVLHLDWGRLKVLYR